VRNDTLDQAIVPYQNRVDAEEDAPAGGGRVEVLAFH